MIHHPTLSLLFCLIILTTLSSSYISPVMEGGQEHMNPPPTSSSSSPPLSLPLILQPQNSPYHLFTPSVLKPPLPPLQPHDHKVLSPLDIDWINLLSGQAGQGLVSHDQIINYRAVPGMVDMSTASGASAENSMEGDDDRREQKSSKKRKGGGNYKMRKASRPRFAFQTRSADDILDDGYRWRKYGQKAVKNSLYPRSYYRCTHHTCNVKKQIQRLSKDTSIVVTTYEGTHNHPCEKLMETLTPLLRQMQFLSRF